MLYAQFIAIVVYFIQARIHLAIRPCFFAEGRPIIDELWKHFDGLKQARLNKEDSDEHEEEKRTDLKKDDVRKLISIVEYNL